MTEIQDLNIEDKLIKKKKIYIPITYEDITKLKHKDCICLCHDEGKKFMSGCCGGYQDEK